MRIILLIVIAFFLVLWVRAVLDVFQRRTDLSTGGKAMWTIAMLVFPFIGIFVYMMLRPADSQIAQRSHR